MKKRYLLDTCAAIDLILWPQGPVSQRIAEVGVSACAITDITLYELYCGAYASRDRAQNVALVGRLEEWLPILPSRDAYQEAARQRSELKRRGEMIEDFDLLIGSTAICNGRILITGNGSHMGRLSGLVLEDWMKE